jgi:hypothetical protein
MGYIYKIQNLINGNVYIGQTVKPVEKRFQQHRNNYDKPYFSQLTLYKAFKKYGLDSFSFETLEKVDNEKLDEREKYWIDYYDSYKNGYNMTLGGRLVELYKWDLQEILDLYHLHKSARKVAEIIGCDHSTIDHLLNANNIPRYSRGEQFNKIVCLEKQGNIEKFNSTREAAQWLIDNHYSKTNKIKVVIAAIGHAVRKNGTYLNFTIYYESKI